MRRLISYATSSLVAIGLLVLASPPVEAKTGELPGRWTEVRSENFIVVGNARPKELRQVATRFEQFRAVLAQEMPRFASASGPPLLVFAPANGRAMGRLTATGRGPAGFFSDSITDRFAAVQADLVGGEDFGVVYHEYFHFLAHQAGLKLPLWLGEGLADFWGGGTRLTKKEAEIARAIDMRLRYLRPANLIPLDVLFSVDHSSEYYREPFKTADFYAQSWGLTHYLMLGEESGERKRHLAEYLKLLAQSKNSLDAAREAFGDLDTLMDELKVYRRQLTYSYFRLPLPPAPTASSLRERPLTTGEAAALVARFSYHARGQGDMKGLLDQAKADAPDLPTTQEALGIYHLREGETAESLAAFERAAAIEGGSALAHYGVAVMRFHQARESGSVTRQELAELEPILVASLQADREFAPAAARLAEVYRRLDGDTPDRPLAAIHRAIELRPDYSNYRLTKARILLEAGRQDEATAIVRQEANAVAGRPPSAMNALCWRGSVWGFADIVLPTCDLAVQEEPDLTAYLDSRAVARVLTGDLEGALADFETALADEAIWDEEPKKARQAWVAELREGRNPFGERGHLALADDPLLDGVGWLR